MCPYNYAFGTRHMNVCGAGLPQPGEEGDGNCRPLEARNHRGPQPLSHFGPRGRHVSVHGFPQYKRSCPLYFPRPSFERTPDVSSVRVWL